MLLAKLVFFYKIYHEHSALWLQFEAIVFTYRNQFTIKSDEQEFSVTLYVVNFSQNDIMNPNLVLKLHLMPNN